MFKKYQPQLLPIFFLSFLILQEGGRNLGVLGNLALVSDFYKDPYNLSKMTIYSVVDISDLLITMGVCCITGLLFGFGLVIWLNKKYKLAWIYGGIIFIGLMMQPIFFPGLIRSTKGMFSVFGIAYLKGPIYHILLGISLLCLGSVILIRWGRPNTQTEIHPN